MSTKSKPEFQVGHVTPISLPSRSLQEIVKIFTEADRLNREAHAREVQDLRDENKILFAMLGSLVMCDAGGFDPMNKKSRKGSKK
jgi:hypothetical protein